MILSMYYLHNAVCDVSYYNDIVVSYTVVIRRTMWYYYKRTRYYYYMRRVHNILKVFWNYYSNVSARVCVCHGVLLFKSA